MHTNTPADQHRQRYVTERLIQLVPGIFDDVLDYPAFTVDRNYIPPQKLPYQVG